MVPSTSEAKRMIAQGAVSINGIKVTTESVPPEKELVIKVGKRNFRKVVIEN